MPSKTYDLICSLGGNCSVAHNLKYRNLRDCAYPFDWTYFESDEAIYQLADNFKNKFENYMKKENLQELSINIHHTDKIQYFDNVGKIIWANQFNFKIDENDKKYNEIKNKFERRFNRLIEHIECAHKILFIFAIKYETELNAYKYLLTELKKLYPNKEIDIKVLSFNSKKNEQIKKDYIEINYYQRNQNDYDFYHTNYEWAFLDNLKLNKKKKRSRMTFDLFNYKIKINWERKE